MKNTAKKIVAVSGLNTHNLSAEELAEAMDWRANTYVGSKNPDWKDSWDRAGVEKLVNSAKEYYEYKTGKELPYNLAVHGPWVSCPNGYKLWEDDRFDSPSAEEMVGIAARMASWLKIIADDSLVGLQRIMEKNLGYGMNASWTRISPYNFLNVWNSPHTAEKMFWKAYRRAWQILKPFGLAPSWEAVGQVMTASNVSHLVGKMAFAIAAKTVNQVLSFRINKNFSGNSIQILVKARGVGEWLSQDDYTVLHWAVSRIEAGEFSCLREAVAQSGRLLPDDTDGVELMLDPETVVTIHGVQCTEGWNNGGGQYLLQQVHTNRTYHYNMYWCETSRQAVKEALKAWRRQAKLEREQADLVSFLRGDYGFCPLIRREESYRAGNCQSGTAGWLQRQGWENKQFIPAEWLIPHLDYNLVRNTAMVLYKDMAECSVEFIPSC
jgi:hypothetical protein